MNRTGDRSARPNVVPWPPIALVVAALAAVGLGRLFPLPITAGALPLIFGWVVLAVGVALDGSAMIFMRRAKTNILPNRGADALVVSGPFRFTRNPIYVGNTVALVGLGLILGNAWFFIAAGAAALFVDRFAVRREEDHLAARFGAAWADYAQRTPRWLLK